MINAPYDSKISDRSEGMFTLPWKMWLSALQHTINNLSIGTGGGSDIDGGNASSIYVSINPLDGGGA